MERKKINLNYEVLELLSIIILLYMEFLVLGSAKN